MDRLRSDACGRREGACEPFRGGLLRALGTVVSETLWATRCAVCDAPGALLCRRCAEQLPFIDANRACPHCGAPFGRVQCTECNRTLLAQSGHEHLPLDGLASALVLDDATRRMATTYKDRGERRMASVMGAMVASVVPPRWMGGDAAVTFVPATAAARGRRGFDHGQLLAQAAADALGLPCLSLLERPSSTDQRRLGRRARLGNLGKAMEARSDVAMPTRVIVIDDVCTTGATLYGTADALRQAGARRIYGATFARVWD